VQSDDATAEIARGCIAGQQDLTNVIGEASDRRGADAGRRCGNDAISTSSGIDSAEVELRSLSSA
jgi:hypothetical protein